MKRPTTRVPHFVLLYLLILGFLPTTAPSDPMTAEVLIDAPDAQEIALFEELAGWVEGDRFSDRPLRQAIRDAVVGDSVSFELFRGFHDQTARAERLRRVPFGETIRRAAARHDVDALLVAAVAEAESGFDPRAISPRGAVGLMQIMPATAAGVAADPRRLTEPAFNLDLGARYLGQLLENHDRDLVLALAAYNAGPANVRRYGGLPPFRETRSYVDRVLHLYVDHHRALWRESELGELLSSRGFTPG